MTNVPRTLPSLPTLPIISNPSRYFQQVTLNSRRYSYTELQQVVAETVFKDVVMVLLLLFYAMNLEILNTKN